MVHYGGRSPLCTTLSAVGQGDHGGRSPLCRRRGLTGVYPCAVGQGDHGGRSPLCTTLSAVGGVLQGFTPVGDGVPCLKQLFSLYILFIYLYIIYYIKHICQINHALAHAPAKPKPDATNGHSNINAASTANIRKVFHNVSIARGVEPPVSPPAYGTGDSVPRKPPSLRH